MPSVRVYKSPNIAEFAVSNMLLISQELQKRVAEGFELPADEVEVIWFTPEFALNEIRFGVEIIFSYTPEVFFPTRTQIQKVASQVMEYLSTVPMPDFPVTPESLSCWVRPQPEAIFCWRDLQ